MDSELHLPWENDSLKALLLKVIQTGETTKVDFKRQLNITTTEHHGELLKDINAFANTYDQNYQNHGFIILGVSGNSLTHTIFDQNADGLQARIDELIKNYIEPFVPTQVRIFGDGQTKWGVIIIPPTRTAPHVFVKDLSKCHPGDIFVRKGTTTAKAGPADYARFFRLHLDEYTYELREQIENLKRDVAKLKSDYRRPSEPNAERVPGMEKNLAPSTIASNQTIIAGQGDSANLLRAIENAFARESDAITTGLISEVQKIQKFLASDDIPWNIPEANPEVCKSILDQNDDVSAIFWEALGNIIYHDDLGKYDEVVIRALSYLAKRSEAPSGKVFNEWGTGIRYLPLVVSLYIVFIVGSSKKRFSLLKKVSALTINPRSRYEEGLPIPRVLFYIRSAEAIFQSQHPGYPNEKWCDAVGTRVELILQRRLNISDPLWDQRERFFIGEFLLCLTPLDVLNRETKTPEIGYPSAGIFLYFSDAEPIIKRFLRDQAKEAAVAFKRPFKEILGDFDRTARELLSGFCFGGGFVEGATAAAYPENPKKENSPGVS
jgi:hypothetical protein